MGIQCINVVTTENAHINVRSYLLHGIEHSNNGSNGPYPKTGGWGCGDTGRIYLLFQGIFTSIYMYYSIYFLYSMRFYLLRMILDEAPSVIIFEHYAWQDVSQQATWTTIFMYPLVI